MRKSDAGVKEGIKKNCNWSCSIPQSPLVCLTVYKRGAVEVVWRLADEDR
jgi:hypothetical protein